MALWLTFGMATSTSPPANVPDTPLYKLVSDRLGRDPLEYIRERRAETPPMPFVRITIEMMAICNRGAKNEADRVYFTHEVPRRWLLASEQAAADTAAA